MISAQRRTGAIMGMMLTSFVGVALAAKPDKAAVPAVQAGQAQIVFLRHSVVGAKANTLVYETTSGQPKVIGIIPNNRKLVVNVPPGEHVFMIGNLPTCDFLQASVLPDKRYYAVVVSRWPDGFTLRPVRNGEARPGEYSFKSEEYPDLLKYTTLAGRAPDSYVQSEMKNAETYYPAKWQQWQSKTGEQKFALTLRPEDAES
jgi:hypothetical protein